MSANSAISRKKPSYPINEKLRKFLKHYGREAKIEVRYEDLLHFSGSVPVYDKKGKDTLWESVFYAPSEMDVLHRALTGIYALLKTGGDLSVMVHLNVERIDYCTFGNSNPFRIRIKNLFNDNYDYFYIKRADASRIYGLELEHILSPNRISYFVNNQTLVEEHIMGIPGDQFIQSNLTAPDVNPVRIAKEFVKFNERCFIRLLGDMRAYNYVFDITPDFEDVHYRIRAIDFDQQSFEGRKNLYLPQFFKDNYELVKLTMQYMTPETIVQYQMEEHTLIEKRIKAARYMIMDLLNAMMMDPLSENSKINNLRNELALHYKEEAFLKCQTMGALVKQSLKVIIKRNRQHSEKRLDGLNVKERNP